MNKAPNITYLSIADISYYIHNKFNEDANLKSPVYLVGEISNFRPRPTHQYFNLKDERSSINVVCFANKYQKLKFTPKNGMKVYAKGYISTYPKTGAYQYYLDTMEPSGVGQLYQALTDLKSKLTTEGLFSRDHKQAIPKYPSKIAVITSQSGAVIKDIIKTTNLRNPTVQIDLYPTAVQGDKAADELCAQLRNVINTHKYDTLIMGRGGGSIEDLWPFNDEKLAHLIYQSPIPIISAIGHQTDFTIADYVADVRAATPTAAAEIAVPDRTNLNHELDGLNTTMINYIKTKLAHHIHEVTRLTHSSEMNNAQSILKGPITKVNTYEQQLINAIQHQLLDLQTDYVNIKSQLANLNPATYVKDRKHWYQRLQHELRENMEQYLSQTSLEIDNNMRMLNHLSPHNLVKKGYIYVTHNHKAIKNGNELSPGDSIELHFADTTITASIDVVDHHNS